MKNVPYIKQYDSNGICTNPIEKSYPSNIFPNRSSRRHLALRSTKHPTNNKKGIRLVVTNIGKGQFVKYTMNTQVIGKKRIIHYT